MDRRVIHGVSIRADVCGAGTICENKIYTGQITDVRLLHPQKKAQFQFHRTTPFIS